MNRIRATAVLLLTLASASAVATTIYRSLDASGTMRFSDKPPEDAASVEVIHLAVPPPVSAPNSQQLIADMIATTERLREDRLRRTKERAPKPSRPDPAAAEQAPRQPVQGWHYPGPYRHGYHVVPPRHRQPDYQYPRREPDTRSERDRRRDAMGGTWYIPRQLPGSERPSRTR